MNTIKLTLRIEETDEKANSLMTNILSHKGLQHVTWKSDAELSAVIQDESVQNVISVLGNEIVPFIRECSVSQPNAETKNKSKF